MESIFQDLDQAPSLQSPIGIDQQESFPNSPFGNPYLRNENSSMHTPFETTEEEHDAYEFADSILFNNDFITSGGRAQAFISGYIHPESSTRVYYESSDTDAEVVSARVKINPPKWYWGVYLQLFMNYSLVLYINSWMHCGGVSYATSLQYLVSFL